MRYSALLLILLFSSSTLSGQTLPAPSTYVEGEGLRIPVYEGFESFAPLLEQSGDTLRVINFWATWCAPCVEELPYFEELTERFPGARLQVLLVSLDFRKQLSRRLLPFLAPRESTATVVVLDEPDADAWINAVDSSWSGAIPATLLLGPGIRSFHEQSFTRQELDELVQSQLEKLP